MKKQTGEHHRGEPVTALVKHHAERTGQRVGKTWAAIRKVC